MCMILILTKSLPAISKEAGNNGKNTWDQTDMGFNTEVRTTLIHNFLITKQIILPNLPSGCKN